VSGVSCSRCFLLKELDCFTSIQEPKTRHFRHSYLKADKVSKTEGTKKVEHEHTYHFQRCADAVYKRIIKISP